MRKLLALGMGLVFLVALVLPVFGQETCEVDFGTVYVDYFSGPIPSLRPGDRVTIRAESTAGDCHVVLVDMKSDPPRNYVEIGEVEATIGASRPELDVWLEVHFPAVGEVALSLSVNNLCVRDFSFLRDGDPFPTSTTTPTRTPMPTETPTPTKTPKPPMPVFLPIASR